MMERFGMSFRSTSKPNLEPLALPFSEACSASGHGRDKGYDKLKDGRWESYMDGGTRMVTLASIKADQARMLAVDNGKFKRSNCRGQKTDAPVGSAIPEVAR
jgi:hypothetical protein